MRTIVNAVLSYGLLSVPVGVATAAKRNDPSFRTLHRECQTPIKQKRWCPTCDRELLSDEGVKGYEYAKGEFVVVDEAALEAVAAERSKVIALTKFVPRDQIDPLFFEQSYWLTPNEKLAKPYVLLENTLAGGNLAGMGTQSVWGKETPALIYPHAGLLVLAKLFCFDEVATITPEVSKLLGAEFSEDERKMATQLLGLLTSDFDPSELVSVSRQRMDSLISDLIAGEEVKTAKPEPAPALTIDIQDALKESIKQAKQKIAA